MFHVEQIKMEHLQQCPVCNQTKFSPFLSCTDYTATKEVFELQQCDACNFIFTNPRPNLAVVGKYYNVENYISHSGTKKGFINTLYHYARLYTLSKKKKQINKLSPKGKLLDIGCGTGNFLAYMNNDGWEILGVEPDDTTRNEANQICNGKVYAEEKLNELEKQQFDVITMWHVLEHVYDLETRVKQLKSLLKPNGVLLIAVPNCSSYDAQHYGKYWGAYDVPRHLYHFKPNNIKQLFEKQSFVVEKVLPMVLDSFYVSMLSEKYKQGNIVKGVFIGFLSNIRAMFKKDTWSSQIYVIRNKK